jgi:hypothetical protein
MEYQTLFGRLRDGSTLSEDEISWLASYVSTHFDMNLWAEVMEALLDNGDTRGVSHFHNALAPQILALFGPPL